MKIVKLEAQNVKRLKAVQITPQGNTIVIGGQNGQGKTSVLDSIAYALAGKSAICDKPIRDGERKAEIVCDLGDLTVTRTFTQKGGSIIVKNAEGAVYPTPQTILDELTGKLTFDPLAFTRQPQKKQLETLKGLVGLDFSEQDKSRKEIYESRALVNKSIVDTRSRLESLQRVMVDGKPLEEVSVSELMAELENRRQHNNEIKKDQAFLEQMESELSATKREEESLTEQLALVRTKIKNNQDCIETHKKRMAGYSPRNEEEVSEQIQNAEETNRQARETRESIDLEVKLDELRDRSEDMTSKMNDIDKAKTEAMSKAEFPVKGLAFDEDGVTFNNLPFDQCSSAEQLRVSVAMGLAMNPKLKVLLIRDGSLLDENSLKLIAEMAAEKDAQVWIERVGEGQECQVVIEDGAVKPPKKDPAMQLAEQFKTE